MLLLHLPILPILLQIKALNIPFSPSSYLFIAFLSLERPLPLLQPMADNRLFMNSFTDCPISGGEPSHTSATNYHLICLFAFDAHDGGHNSYASLTTPPSSPASHSSPSPHSTTSPTPTYGMVFARSFCLHGGV